VLSVQLERRGVAVASALVALALVAMAMTLIGCAATTTGTPAQGQAYKLGAGDKLRVVVLSDMDLSGDYEVDATSSISVRLIGRLSVAGMTLAELEALLAERYRSSGYLRDPKLSVELMSARPFFVLGEVSKPGSYPYVSGLTVAQAVAIAGGYTRRASSSRITVKRFGSSAGAEESVTEDAPLLPGDIMRVPERFF
jgi:polysaccharide export outer membrane protein